jgi:hypothetical protein
VIALLLGVILDSINVSPATTFVATIEFESVVSAPTTCGNADTAGAFSTRPTPPAR